MSFVSTYNTWHGYVTSTPKEGWCLETQVDDMVFRPAADEVEGCIGFTLPVCPFVCRRKPVLSITSLPLEGSFLYSVGYLPLIVGVSCITT